MILRVGSIMGDLVKNLVIWTVIAVVIMSLFTGVGGRNTASQEFNYTDFMQQVQTGQVEEVTISGREISGSFKSGESFITLIVLKQIILH
jgi:cell division protease FtsH